MSTTHFLSKMELFLFNTAAVDIKFEIFIILVQRMCSWFVILDVTHSDGRYVIGSVRTDPYSWFDGAQP